MPNVEIHGYGDESESKCAQVEQALVDDFDPDQTITTVYHTSARTIKGDAAPFLRIVASPKSLGKIIELLELLNDDREVMPLGQFIAKKA
mgnify:CR=1 FL=1